MACQNHLTIQTEAQNLLDIMELLSYLCFLQSTSTDSHSSTLSVIYWIIFGSKTKDDHLHPNIMVCAVLVQVLNLFCFFITYCVVQLLGNRLRPQLVSLYSLLLFLPFHVGNNMTTAFICRHLINQLLPSDPAHHYMSDFCCPFTSWSISFPQEARKSANDISDDTNIWYIRL